MRSIFFVLIAIISANSLAQTEGSKVPKIKHDALEINNGMAFYKGKPYTGLSLTYWENKRVNEMFSWKDGLKDGEYKELTEEGVTVTLITWAAGVKSGPFLYRYPTGAKESEGYFLDNQLDGEIIGYYVNGNVRYKNTYSKGIRHGRSLTWYGNGAPEQISNFVNDLPDGEVFAYYPDSVLRYECVYSMGVRNGRYYRFHKSGCAAEESYYKNGKMDSIRRIWNEITCTLILEENYDNGIKSGISIDYDISGDTLKMTTWKYGKLNGEYKEWKSKNESVSVGRKKHKGDAHLFTQTRGIDVIGNYTDGQPDGFWQYGMFTHYQHREGNYEQGTMVGEWKFYDQNGKLLMRIWYDDDGNNIKEKHYKRAK